MSASSGPRADKPGKGPNAPASGGPGAWRDTPNFVPAPGRHFGPAAHGVTPTTTALDALLGNIGWLVVLTTRTNQRWKAILTATTEDGQCGAALRNAKDLDNPSAPIREHVFIPAQSIKSCVPQGPQLTLQQLTVVVNGTKPGGNNLDGSSRELVASEDQRLARKKQAVVKLEREKGMAEPVAFAQASKLNESISKDPIPIPTNDAEKARRIIEKSNQDAASAKARNIRGPQVAASTSSTLLEKRSTPPVRTAGEMAPAAKKHTHKDPFLSVDPVRDGKEQKPTPESGTLRLDANVSRFRSDHSVSSSTSASEGATLAPEPKSAAGAVSLSVKSVGSGNEREPSPLSAASRLNANAPVFKPVSAHEQGRGAPANVSASGGATRPPRSGTAAGAGSLNIKPVARGKEREPSPMRPSPMSATSQLNANAPIFRPGNGVSASGSASGGTTPSPKLRAVADAVPLGIEPVADVKERELSLGNGVSASVPVSGGATPSLKIGTVDDVVPLSVEPVTGGKKQEPSPMSAASRLNANAPVFRPAHEQEASAAVLSSEGEMPSAKTGAAGAVLLSIKPVADGKEREPSPMSAMSQLNVNAPIFRPGSGASANGSTPGGATPSPKPKMTADAPGSTVPHWLSQPPHPQPQQSPAQAPQAPQAPQPQPQPPRPPPPVPGPYEDEHSRSQYMQTQAHPYPYPYPGQPPMQAMMQVPPTTVPPGYIQPPYMPSMPCPPPQMGPNQYEHEQTHARQRMIVNSTMTSTEIARVLAKHGCTDLTQRLDLKSCSAFAVSHGGFGEVYAGRLVNDVPVAIKIFRLQVTHGEATKHLKHTAKELYTWSKCRHPNVVRLLGLTEFRGQIGMVSLWMSNGNLRSYLARYPNANRYQLCYGISNGLAYLHCTGITHGDLKGANVLVSDDGAPLITDFGNSMLNTNQSLHFTHTAAESNISPRWTAPEVLEGLVTLSCPADVFSLGMTFLETMTGEVPYHELLDRAVYVAIVIKRKVPSRPEAHIPTGSERDDRLWSLLEKCWDIEPEHRPNAEQVRHSMLEIVNLDGINKPAAMHSAHH